MIDGWRDTVADISFNFDLSRATAASAKARAVSLSRRSRVASTCPALTTSLSSTATVAICPEMRGAIVA
jgi:hypothetical protein